MRTGHWIAIDFVVAAFAAIFVMTAVHPSYRLIHPGQAWFPAALLVAAGVFVPVALRRRAPMMAFGGLLVLAVMVSGMAIAVAGVIFLAVAYALYTVTLTSSKRTGAAALGLVLALMVIITEGRPAHRFARPVLTTGVLGGCTSFSTYVVDT